jgi:hypothetical protein
MKSPNTDTFNFRPIYDKYENVAKVSAAAILALGSVGIAANVFQSDPKFENDSHANAILIDKQNKEASLSSDLEKEKRPEALITQALIDGPLNADDVIGTYSIEQDEFIGDAIINRAAKAGYIIDIVNNQDDLLAVELSSKQFGSLYHKGDKFDLFKTDLDGDHEPEILARRTKSDE